MKKFYCLAALFLAISCSSSNTKEDPLILPPNFAQMPDLTKTQPPTKEDSQQSIAKLKELLLKSDEQ